MKPLFSPFQTWLLGQGAILMGAWGREATSSMWPLAFGASTGMMCTAPLVRQLLARWRRSRGL